VESPDNWEGGCAKKAAALSELLRRHKKFVYLDADEYLVQQIPWLCGFTGELALAIAPPPPEGVRWRAQKYRLHGDRYGERFLTGVMAVNRTRRVEALFAEWTRLATEHPDEWDEQLLFHAHRKMTNAPKVFGVPDDHRVLPLAGSAQRIGHRSGSNRYWRLSDKRFRPERKVLLLGSAAYVPEWWDKHGESYLEAGYSPVCMNNAWRAIPRDDVHYWMRPADFKGEEPPEFIPRNSNLPRNKSCKLQMWRCRPHWDPSLYTTLTHSLYHLANEAFFDHVRLIVHIVGSDFDYRGEQTHFYGMGTPDPLRYGLPRLQHALSKVMSVYQLCGHSLFNAGGRGWSLLPFARADGPKTKEQTYMVKPEIISADEFAKRLVYKFDRDLFKTANGVPCEANDPARKFLLGRKGRTIAIAEAAKLGLIVVDQGGAKRQSSKPKAGPKKAEPALVTGAKLRPRAQTSKAK
jgi:hypothetical protein